MSGALKPGAVKREPAIEIPEIVTGTVPAEESITDCVAVWPTLTLPKLIVLALSLSVGVAGFNCRSMKADPPFAVAVNTAVAADATADTVAANVALAVFFTTVTVDGTVAAGLLLDSFKVVPLGEIPLRMTVQLSVPAPAIDEYVQVTLLGMIAVRCPRRRLSEFWFTVKCSPNLSPPTLTASASKPGTLPVEAAEATQPLAVPIGAIAGGVVSDPGPSLPREAFDAPPNAWCSVSISAVEGREANSAPDALFVGYAPHPDKRRHPVTNVAKISLLCRLSR